MQSYAEITCTKLCCCFFKKSNTPATTLDWSWIFWSCVLKLTDRISQATWRICNKDCSHSNRNYKVLQYLNTPISKNESKVLLYNENFMTKRFSYHWYLSIHWSTQLIILWIKWTSRRWLPSNQRIFLVLKDLALDFLQQFYYKDTKSEFRYRIMRINNSQMWRKF